MKDCTPGKASHLASSNKLTASSVVNTVKAFPTQGLIKVIVTLFCREIFLFTKSERWTEDVCQMQ